MANPANDQWLAQLQQEAALPADPVAQQVAMEAAQLAAQQEAAQRAAQEEAARRATPPALNMDAALRDLYAQMEHLRRQNAALEARAQQPAAPAPAVAIPGAKMTVRLTEPRRYSGRPAEDPEEYLNSVEQYFLLGGVHDDRQRIMLAGQFLQDSARDWFLVVYKTADIVEHPANYTWAGFKDALRQRFVARDPADTARAQLFRLHQGRMSLRDYTLQFQHLATRAGTVSDADLKVLYLDRMDQTIAMQVGMRFPATLGDAIHLAEQVLVHSRPISASFSRPISTSFPRPPPWQPSRPQRSGPTPMELGAMERHAPARRDQKKTPTQTLQEMGVTRDQYEERKRSGACLRCGAQSHLIRECPQMHRGPGGGTRLRHNQTR